MVARRAISILAGVSDRVAAAAPALSHSIERRVLARMVPGLAGEARARPLMPLRPESLLASSALGDSPVALYLHIPFCAAVCSYCLFNRSANTKPLARYVEALHLELARYAELPRLRGSSLSSLYVGGGTPTLLPAEALARLLGAVRERFRFAPGFQSSIEATPDTLGEDKLAAMVAGGLDRLSIGVQSFDDGVLAEMGRRHLGIDAEVAIDSARRAGVPEVSIDLIYGIPSQRPAAFADGVQRAIDAGVTHLSMFPLVDRKQRALDRAGADARDACYELARARLSAAGFRQYSTEDFTRGRECRYETDAWRVPRKPVLGLGLSALSSIAGTFFANEPRLADYLRRLDAGELPVAGGRVITAREEAMRSLLMGLKYRVLDLDELRRAHGSRAAREAAVAAALLEALGYVRRRGDTLQLTARGERFAARNFAAMILGILELHSRPAPRAARAEGGGARASAVFADRFSLARADSDVTLRP